MILRTYIQPIIRALLSGIIIVLGYATFGIAEYFDRIYLILISFLIIYFYQKKYRNNDMIGVLVILFGWCIFDEIFFLSINIPLSKITTYAISLFVIYKFKHDKLTAYFVTPLIFITILVEIYWYMNNYPAPLINYYVALIVINLIARDMFTLRFAYTIKYFSLKSHILEIDQTLQNICKYNVFIISAMLIEYLIRHLLPVDPLLIYEIYPFLQHSLAVLTAVILTDYTYKAETTIKA